MSMIFNNTELTAVEFNGVDLTEVYFNNELVFQKGGGILPNVILQKTRDDNVAVENEDGIRLASLSSAYYSYCSASWLLNINNINKIIVTGNVTSVGTYQIYTMYFGLGDYDHLTISPNIGAGDHPMNITYFNDKYDVTELGEFTREIDLSSYTFNTDDIYFHILTDMGADVTITSIVLVMKDSHYVPMLTGSMSYQNVGSVAEYDGKNFVLQTSGNASYYMYTMASLELDFTDLNSITIKGTGLNQGETADMWIGVGDYNEVHAENNSKYFAVKFLDGWYDVTADVQHTFTGDVSDVTGTHYLNIMCDRGVGFRITDIIIT